MNEQRNNPMHGVTLKDMLESLVADYGWPELAKRISIGCFANNPSMKSSLKFLRKTPWARTKVESLYMDRQQNLKQRQLKKVWKKKV
jgi:uncharacterized protein (DUF2132 family)